MQEAGIRQMVSDHYECLRKSSIRDLFPEDDKAFEQAKKNSADFFIQVLGGPKYYMQNRGRPKLADRHSPFKITPQARVVWLKCYINVLSHLDVKEELVLSFWNYLNIFSLWMVNAEQGANE